jgi:quercetin dioxygenase-like cupin family protein
MQTGFIDIDKVPSISPVPGCRMRTPHGQHLMLSYLEMDAGAEVPLHDHPHEQGGVLLSGRLQLTIGDETRIVEAGSFFLIPSGVPHRAVAVDGPVRVLDVFSPVREDYAELANRYIPPLPGSNDK